MARLHFVKSARKDNSVAKKGESYYWWKFRFGGKYYSKDRPRRSQLTQSGFYSQLYEIQDSVGDMEISSIQDSIDSIISELEGLSDECQGALDNMPEHLQDSSDSGILLQERIGQIESVIGELQNIDTDMEECADEECRKNKFDEIMEEVDGLLSDIP